MRVGICVLLYCTWPRVTQPKALSIAPQRLMIGDLGHGSSSSNIQLKHVMVQVLHPSQHSLNYIENHNVLPMMKGQLWSSFEYQRSLQNPHARSSFTDFTVPASLQQRSFIRRCNAFINIYSSSLALFPNPNLRCSLRDSVKRAEEILKPSRPSKLRGLIMRVSLHYSLSLESDSGSHIEQ